jgi:hypothetical protein
VLSGTRLDVTALTQNLSQRFYGLKFISLLRIRIYLRRRDVDPCAFGDSTRRDGPRSEPLATLLRPQIPISFLLLRIRIYLRRHDEDPCALGDST